MSGALEYQQEYETYEQINGREYMMARPTVNHSRIARNIVGIFDRHLIGKTCEAFGKTDVYLSDKDYIIPDAMIVCNPDIITKKRIAGVPDLIVEILSPSTSRRDRLEKLRLYKKYGVKEYWIVDPRGKSVEVYLLKEGSFELENVYYPYSDEEWSEMDDEERAEAETQKAMIEEEKA